MVLILPDVFIRHDENDENLLIDVNLPGAKKENIKLEFSKNGFCVDAKNKEGNIEFYGCYTVAHEIIVDKIEASYEDGVLKIKAPFKKEELKEIKIQ